MGFRSSAFASGAQGYPGTSGSVSRCQVLPYFIPSIQCFSIVHWYRPKTHPASLELTLRVLSSLRRVAVIVYITVIFSMIVWPTEPNWDYVMAQEILCKCFELMSSLDWHRCCQILTFIKIFQHSEPVNLGFSLTVIIKIQINAKEMMLCNLCVGLIILFPQRNSSLPDDTNVARLQEELIAVKLREAEALTGLKELRQQVRDLEDHWQVSTSQQRVSHVFVCHSAMDNWLTLLPFVSVIWHGLQVVGKTTKGRTH